MNLNPIATHIPETALQPGPDVYPWDISPIVAEVQELLIAQGARLVIDGNFGWRTEAAVKAYQRRHGLRVDGMVGSQTWAMLKRTIQPGSRPLTLGRSGADVYELQGLLQIHGHLIQRDGVFGDETHSAVIAFQTQHHLEPDGIVRPVTWALLGRRRHSVPKSKR